MNELIDNILTEWAYRVNDGMPNPKNQYHLVKLQESMKSLKVDGDVINMVMNRLYGKRVITEGATNRTEDLHEIFFAVAYKLTLSQQDIHQTIYALKESYNQISITYLIYRINLWQFDKLLFLCITKY